MWRWSNWFPGKLLDSGHELMGVNMNDLWRLKINYHRRFVATTSIITYVILLDDLWGVLVYHQRCGLWTMQTLQLCGCSDGGGGGGDTGGHLLSSINLWFFTVLQDLVRCEHVLNYLCLWSVLYMRQKSIKGPN